MDGLLLDTERLLTAAHEDICKRYDRQLSSELKVHASKAYVKGSRAPLQKGTSHKRALAGPQAKMLGRKAGQSADAFISTLGLEGQLTRQEFLRQREAALTSVFPSCEFMPGAHACNACSDLCFCQSLMQEPHAGAERLVSHLVRAHSAAQEATFHDLAWR